MTRTSGYRTRITPIIFLLAVLALIGTPVLAGDCYRAVVTEALDLPDGTTASDGGTVTVCRVRQLSPVAVLHSLDVDGTSQGLFIGTRQSVEAADATSPAAFVFARNDSQALELRAVAYGAGGRFAAYRADRIGAGRTRVRTRGSFDLAAASRGDSGAVLIAAAD